jgi:hypothetical protein
MGSTHDLETPIMRTFPRNVAGVSSVSPSPASAASGAPQSGVLQPEGEQNDYQRCPGHHSRTDLHLYALALLCSGLVEMIANWIKKRAKYLLRGIRDLLDDVVPSDVAAAQHMGWMECTAQGVLLENQRYDQMLHAPVPTPPREPVAAVPPAAPSTTPPPEQPMHRDKITLSDVMGHPLVQPFRHATSLGKPTRNPSYLPSSVFALTLVDLLTPGSMETNFADIERGVRALQNSPKLQQSLSSIVKAARGEVDSFISGAQTWFDRQMDRVTGSYKRWAKRWVIVLAVVVVGVGNIDSIAIAACTPAVQPGLSRCSRSTLRTSAAHPTTRRGAYSRPRTSWRRSRYRWAGQRPIQATAHGVGR